MRVEQFPYRWNQACQLLQRLTVACVAFLLAVQPRYLYTDESLEFFERKIRPVLVEHCYECHSAEGDSIQGGLRLDHRRGLLIGGDSGPSILPGQPKESLLLEAIRYESFEMPPEGKLPQQVIADFEKWIENGAADPRQHAQDGIAKEMAAGAEELWSLQPVKHPIPPRVADRHWPKAPIDHFLLARMEQAGVTPVDDAEPQRLLRRLYFDLIGLPPSPEEVEAFLRDNQRRGRDAAVEAVVDRLLASLHFGERWGRHWLDVARYAESNGMAWNMSLPYAWRYRNYVIDAFNEDKPFSDFIVEQLSGDLLAAEDERRRRELLTATGFLALGPKPLPEKDNQIEENRPDWVDEQLNVIGKSILGLTVGCARCHDHKFDPIPTKDYYALAGIFFSTEILSGPKIGKPALWRKTRIYDDTVHALADDQEIEEARGAQRKYEELEAELKRLEKQKPKREDEIDRLKSELEEVQKNAPRLDYAHGVRDAGKVGPTDVRVRGQWDRRGEQVRRGFLTVVSFENDYQITKHQSGRLQLARWLTDPRNPLTARVAVNRIWHHLFGRGIVRTVDNFGAGGATPTHPKLLDYLAHRFIHRHQWSVKQLIREIVLSRSYGLSSRHDPDNYTVDPANDLLWRSRPRRIQAEAIRDAMLLVGGRLDPQPLRSSAVAKLNYTLLSPNDTRNIHSSEQTQHRSVYLAVLRGQQTDELLSVFEFPDPGMVVGSRETTTVPSQSLLMMNSPLVLDSADSLAKRVLSTRADDDAKIRQLFYTCLARHPTATELREVRQSLANLSGNEAAKWSAVAQSLLLSSEFRYLY